MHWNGESWVACGRLLSHLVKYSVSIDVTSRPRALDQTRAWIMVPTASLQCLQISRASTGIPCLTQEPPLPRAYPHPPKAHPMTLGRFFLSFQFSLSSPTFRRPVPGHSGLAGGGCHLSVVTDCVAGISGLPSPCRPLST